MLEVDEFAPAGRFSFDQVEQASAVERSWLPEELFSNEVMVEFDPAEERVSARRRVSWDGLVLEESPAKIPSPAEAMMSKPKRLW